MKASKEYVEALRRHYAQDRDGLLRAIEQKAQAIEAHKQLIQEKTAQLEALQHILNREE